MQVYLSRSQELLSGRKDNLEHINFPEQYLEGNKSVHIFLFYSYPNPLYSHSILLTKDADPRISFPFSDYYAESHHLEGYC
jgi:hypothetical protein